MTAPGRAFGAPATDGERQDRWHLEDEREFLERSLADATSEHEAGDMVDADYEALTRRDRARLSAVLDALAALGEHVETKDPPDPAPAPLEAPARRRSPWRTALGVLGLVAVLAGAGLLVAHLASPRLPGQTPTGGVKLNGDQQIDQQLQQASALVQENNIVEALKVYHQVLVEDPTRPEALAESGWLEWEVGRSSGDARLTRQGLAGVKDAVAVAPTFYAGHLFMGTIELQADKNPTAAVAQYRLFLSEHPPASIVTSALPFLKSAFAAAHQALPASLAGRSGG